MEVTSWSIWKGRAIYHFTGPLLIKLTSLGKTHLIPFQWKVYKWDNFSVFFLPHPKGNAKTTALCQTNMTPKHKIKRHELWNTVRLPSFKVLKSTFFFQLGVCSHCHHHHPYQSITVFALIGYFEVTWHLTMKLFPAKISEQTTLQKIYDVSG